MSRGLSQDVLDELNSDHIRPIYLVSIEFDSSTLYLTTAFVVIEYNNNSYIPAPSLLKVGNASENTDLGATGMQVSLSGMDGTIVNAARDDDYQGNDVNVYLGFIDADNSLIGTLTFFEGFIDTITFKQDVDTVTAILKAEHKLIRLSKSKEQNYTSVDQKDKFPNDEGLDFVNAINKVDLVWGE